MASYIDHLHSISSPLTLKRKKDYLDYNLRGVFKEVGFGKIKVLEVGPGLGEFESYLNDHGVREIDIVDNDKGVLDYIAKTTKISKSLLVSDILKVDRQLGQYDVILMMQVLEHLPVSKYISTVNMMFGHLKEKGYLIMVVPNANNPLGLVERYGDLQHTSSFTESSLRDLINGSNLRNFEMLIKGYEIPPYDFLNFLRILLQKMLHFSLLLILIINGGVYYKTMTPNIMLILKKKSLSR